MDRFSLVGNHEIGAIEDLYNSYLKDSQSVDESWRNFFEGFELARKSYGSNTVDLVDKSHIEKEFRILELITGYRQRGHLFTRTNPVRRRRQYSPTLDYHNFGLEESDLNITFEADAPPPANVPPDPQYVVLKLVVLYTPFPPKKSPPGPPLLWL